MGLEIVSLDQPTDSSFNFQHSKERLQAVERPFDQTPLMDKSPIICSFFAGAGFLDLGFERAGFEIAYVNEYFLPFINLGFTFEVQRI